MSSDIDVFFVSDESTPDSRADYLVRIYSQVLHNRQTIVPLELPRYFPLGKILRNGHWLNGFSGGELQEELWWMNLEGINGHEYFAHEENLIVPVDAPEGTWTKAKHDGVRMRYKFAATVRTVNSVTLCGSIRFAMFSCFFPSSELPRSLCLRST